MKRVWHDGKLVKGKIALSPFDRGLTLGDGVFETMAVTNHVALWRYEHIKRMQAVAEAIGIAFSSDEIETAIDALTLRVKGSHVLRLTLSRGEVARGLASDSDRSTLIGTLQPFDVSLRFQPVTLATVATRRNMHSLSSRVKSLSYADNIFAAREAAVLKAEDGVMLNSAGRVACTTIGNIFVETENVLLTPALSEGVLPGIMRAEVIRLAKLLGVKVKEGKISVSELETARAIYVSNSLRFLRPVARLDGKRMASRGKLFELISRGLLNAETEQMVLE
jgi:branched-chain amino acid aminotransferase